ncbi:uncharacterized protein LOC134234778 [Saccostrea cucullata]|uniref:uncharacterized protein LOC134234778 n=1 Tax=Saccostrea cuccullata TaxID=36930 RepID=UPI002ED133BA
MAASAKKYPLGSSQEHIEMCKTHDLPIDMICEECAKTDHKEHDWNTLPTVAAEKRRGLIRFLKKIKEEDPSGIDEKIEKMSLQITNELNHVKSELQRKKQGFVDTLEFMEENNSTMSDYSFIDNYRELTKMLSELEFHMTNCEFTRGDVNDELLNSVFGKTWDLEDIGSKDVEKVNQQGKKEHKFYIFPNDMCVTDTGNVYFTDVRNKSISRLSPSGPVSTVISTDPLVPGGILTGDVIHEYEYQEDGQTRLFTAPYKVTENRKGDICVVNGTGVTTGELIIMSPSGRMKLVYHGLNLIKNPNDVVCDSLCNILVNDLYNKQIHLLSPDGEFLKFN